MRWFSIAIMFYMLLAITWWGVLLYQKNEQLYNEKITYIENSAVYDDSQSGVIEKEKKRQSMMIVGEGIVLGLSLLAGLWIVNRSSNKELATVNNQNNFLLSVSHELKSPIAAIKLALQTLQRQNIPEHSKNKLLGKAVLDANRLENMVQNVLLSANIDNQDLRLFLEEFDLIELVNYHIRQSKSNNSDLHFHFKHQSPNLLIKADKSSIDLVLSNMIENAIKYSPENKQIWIEVRDKDPHVIVDIKDQGIGIDPKHYESIFKRFYRIRDSKARAQPGTGLGLYIVKEIIQAHKGNISIAQNHPKGTVFSIKFEKHG